nr:MAG TPA: BppU domain protein [Caudoviricetes sp.]
MEGFTQHQTIELTQSNPVLVRDQPIVKSDVQALVWIVTVKKNGVPADLAGATASLYCARALSEDGSGGTTYSEATIESGGEVKAVLPRDAANIPGPVGCTIRVTRDGASVAVARMAVMAIDPTGDDILDEGNRIPSLDEIVASIARCDAAAEKAEGAAASVGDALKQVASAIQAANGAASDARNAAGQATDGASAAKAAATTATAAATKIDDMTITATGLAAGAAPTAELTEVGGHYNIVLGLPKGDKGDPGATPQITVQVKTGEPGTAASVKQTGTAEAPVIELTIPRGDTGSIGSLTINGKAPDAAGKVTLTAADVGAASAAEVNQLKDEKVAYTDALTLEEIEASTDLTNKVAGASAVNDLAYLSKIIKKIPCNVTVKDREMTITFDAGYFAFVIINGHSEARQLFFSAAINIGYAASLVSFDNANLYLNPSQSVTANSLTIKADQIQSTDAFTVKAIAIVPIAG